MAYQAQISALKSANDAGIEVQRKIQEEKKTLEIEVQRLKEELGLVFEAREILLSLPAVMSTEGKRGVNEKGGGERRDRGGVDSYSLSSSGSHSISVSEDSRPSAGEVIAAEVGRGNSPSARSASSCFSTKNRPAASSRSAVRLSELEELEKSLDAALGL